MLLSPETSAHGAQMNVSQQIIIGIIIVPRRRLRHFSDVATTQRLISPIQQSDSLAAVPAYF
jgi:hypothetical protein